MFDKSDFWIMFDIKDKTEDDRLTFGKGTGSCFIHITEGDGGQLLDEDIEEGYSWYINIDCGSIDEEWSPEKFKSILENDQIIVECLEGDGGMFLYKEDQDPSVEDLINDAIGQMVRPSQESYFKDSITAIMDRKGNEYQPELDVGL